MMPSPSCNGDRKFCGPRGTLGAMRAADGGEARLPFRQSCGRQESSSSFRCHGEKLCMPHLRSRLSTDEMRRLSLEAARAILIEEGPQAVTLMAVAKRINRTHANILHHFGSAGELRRAM